jgi:amidase
MIGLLLLLVIAAAASVSRTEWRFIVDSIRYPVSEATPEPYVAPLDAPIGLRPDIVFSTASELAARIRSGELSALEVVDAHLSQIYAYNEALNAVIQVNPDARARAVAADEALARGELWGPLHGVPVTIKDQFATKGLRTTNGYLPQIDYVSEEDATVVAKLKKAGAIVLGKTNQPILGMDIQSSNPIFGTTNNPWDLGRTPGGSSGGESAAIAAGLSPLGMGADVGGSIRIPAHSTGIFGHKPTEKRVSGAGITDGMPGGGFQPWWHRLSYGPLARSIEDLALAFSLIAGADLREVDVPGFPVVYPDPKPSGALRIGWTDEFPEQPVSDDTRAALGAFIASLEKAGFPTERATPSSEDLGEIWRVYGDLGSMEFGADLAPVRLFLFLLRRDNRAFPFSLANYKKTLKSRNEIIARMETFLSPYDVYVCPVALIPAFEHQEPAGMMGPLPVYDEVTLSVDDLPVPYWDATVSYTVPFNATGNPVVVIPIGASREGLPIGAQLVARRWRDAELLVAAQQLFNAAGDFRHPPGYGAP